MTIRNAFSGWRLEELNSATKYPSIETYHPLGDKGRLREGPPAFQGPAIVTEKIDGTNARIVCLGKDFLIGSREEWLHASGDLISNPSQRIVETLRGFACPIAEWCDPLWLTVVHGEVYGAQVAKHGGDYANELRGFRVFDAWSMHQDEARALCAKSRAEIASWRDRGGQPFMDEDRLMRTALANLVELTPRLAQVDALPRTLAETAEWLRQWPTTQAGLDAPAGRSEGVVVRSPDRKQIAKIRFEDYARSLRG